MSEYLSTMFSVTTNFIHFNHCKLLTDIEFIIKKSYSCKCPINILSIIGKISLSVFCGFAIILLIIAILPYKMFILLKSFLLYNTFEVWSINIFIFYISCLSIPTTDDIYTKISFIIPPIEHIKILYEHLHKTQKHRRA